MMKGCVWKGLLAAVIALPALSGVARAQRTDNEGCSNETLKGDYAFAVTGWLLSATQLWVPEFIIGITQFDGKGNFTQVDYPANGALMTPSVTDFRAGQTGTYAVRSDCLGSAELDLNVGGTGTGHGVIKLMFVISNGGRSVHAVVAKGISPFATQPSISVVRTDFWKVGPERDDR
jgi:hypothetical protein